LNPPPNLALEPGPPCSAKPPPALLSPPPPQAREWVAVMWPRPPAPPQAVAGCAKQSEAPRRGSAVKIAGTPADA